MWWFENICYVHPPKKDERFQPLTTAPMFFSKSFRPLNVVTHKPRNSTLSRQDCETLGCGERSNSKALPPGVGSEMGPILMDRMKFDANVAGHYVGIALKKIVHEVWVGKRHDPLVKGLDDIVEGVRAGIE